MPGLPDCHLCRAPGAESLSAWDYHVRRMAGAQLDQRYLTGLYCPLRRLADGVHTNIRGRGSELGHRGLRAFRGNHEGMPTGADRRTAIDTLDPAAARAMAEQNGRQLLAEDGLPR